MTDLHKQSLFSSPSQWVMGLFLFCGASVLTVLFGPLFLFFCIVGWLGYVTYMRPDIGVYLMVLLTPMIGLEFQTAWFNPWLGSYASFVSFHAPMVDVWTLFFLCVYSIRACVRWFSKETQTFVLPGFWLYGLFLVSAIFSLVQLSGVQMGESIKYLIRFPLFVYVGYVVLGVNVLSSKEILYRALRLFVSVGVFAAVLGCVSLLVGAYDVAGLHRAVPIPVFGIDVFNFAADVRFGHILLAEFLTLVLPVALYLAYYARTVSERALYLYVSGFVAAVCVLTFSRAGWVTLAFQGVVFLCFFYKHVPWSRVIKMMPGIVAVCAIPIAYMILFLQSSIVSSSNSARIVLTQVGWYMFIGHPWFGNGIGTFTTALAQVSYFTNQFGDPIDAHSIVTKISSEQGLFGMVTFSLFVGWILLSIFIRMKNENYTLEARMAALLSFFLVATPLFFQLFNTQYYSARMWMPIAFALALTFLYRHDTSRSTMYISFVPTKEKGVRTDMS